MSEADDHWEEYKRLIVQFGTEMGDLMRNDPSLQSWREQFETIKFGAPFAEIGALSDRLIDCDHPKVRWWCHWATNNSWPFLVYSAWYQLTQTTERLL